MFSFLLENEYPFQKYVLLAGFLFENVLFFFSELSTISTIFTYTFMFCYHPAGWNRRTALKRSIMNVFIIFQFCTINIKHRECVVIHLRKEELSQVFDFRTFTILIYNNTNMSIFFNFKKLVAIPCLQSISLIEIKDWGRKIDIFPVISLCFSTNRFLIFENNLCSLVDIKCLINFFFPRCAEESSLPV